MKTFVALSASVLIDRNIQIMIVDIYLDVIIIYSLRRY